MIDALGGYTGPSPYAGGPDGDGEAALKGAVGVKVLKAAMETAKSGVETLLSSLGRSVDRSA